MRQPALLIDLDNTLYDYERAAAAARATVLAELARALGTEPTALAAAWDEARTAIPSAATGQALRVARFARLLSTHDALLNDDLDAVAWATRYAAAFAAAIEWAPGAERAFHDLLARRQVLIVTEGYGDIARAVLARLGIGQAPLYATHGTGTTKLDGSAFTAALNQLQLAPDQALVIGDNFTNDVQGSAHIGVASLWLTLGRTQPANAPATLFGTAPDFAAAVALQEGWILARALPPLPAPAQLPPNSTLIDTSHPPERDDPAYARALSACTTTAAEGEVVARLETVALDALRHALGDHPSLTMLGVKRVNSIGSTTRHTAIDAAPDLDLLIETDAAIDAYPIAVLSALLREIAATLAAAPDFAAWCVAATLAPHATTVELDSFGKRGANTLVARFNARHDGVARTLLDVTLTPSSRPGDYHDWMQAHLGAHAPADAARLCAEIRLAKSTLRLLPSVYGSGARGLRPISVEQWVLQVPRHCPSGMAVGSFDAVLGLVHAHRELPFAEFRARFPVWRPGAPGTTARDDTGAATDLLGLLADGDAAEAATRWRKVIALADAYSVRRAQRPDWTPRSLVASISDLEVTP